MSVAKPDAIGLLTLSRPSDEPEQSNAPDRLAALRPAGDSYRYPLKDLTQMTLRGLLMLTAIAAVSHSLLNWTTFHGSGLVVTFAAYIGGVILPLHAVSKIVEFREIYRWIFVIAISTTAVVINRWFRITYLNYDGTWFSWHQVVLIGICANTVAYAALIGVCKGVLVTDRGAQNTHSPNGCG